MSKKIVLFFSIFFAVACISEAATSTWLLRKKLSIVIDDMGYNRQLALKFASLNLPLAYSFLPDATFSTVLSNQLYNKGYTVMIHMPSQPIDYPKDDPGKNAIYTNTSKKRTQFLLNRAYRKVPHATGLNNHMGSAILLDKQHLDYIMEFLRNNHLFFVDSATIQHSLGCHEADKFRVLCAKREVFLDNKKNVNYIKHQINIAINMLNKRNEVLAIGHCNYATYEAIKAMKNKLKPYLVSVEYIVR